jgi:BirA family transcriptional regulator, biotin operon repressor / biotin---[acetyl-CoA-carboxylase] ligase
MLGGRKLGGILLESPGGAAPAKDRLIIGIGINVNNSLKSATDGPALAGTALWDFTAEEHSLQSILVAVVREIHTRLEQLAASDVRLAAAWQRLCLLVNQRVTVLHDGDRRTEGLCAGIDADGALLLQTADGPERLYSGSLRPTEQAAED